VGIAGVFPDPDCGVHGEQSFCRLVHASQTILRTAPNSEVREIWSYAASFPRLNGSGKPIASDPQTGSWLAVDGTCFHPGNQEPDCLLQQYLRHGAERLCRDLEGFFAIVIGDGRSKDVTIITDIVGSYHLFARQMGAITAISSSSLALACLGDTVLDAVACQEFLGTGVMYEDRTIHREVRKLPAATITTVFRGAIAGQRRYWAVSSLSPESLRGEHAVEALWGSLTTAATKVGKMYSSIVSDLTGGYDSRALAAAFVGAGQKFAATVSGPQESPDVVVSKGLADLLELEHVHCPPRGPIVADDLKTALLLTDGERDLIEYTDVARVHTSHAERFQISINGSFGEVARGYWWELLLPRTGARLKLDSHKLALRRYAVTSCTELFQPRFRIDFVEHTRAVIDRVTAGLDTFPNTFQMDAAYIGMRMHRWQGRIASSTTRIWPCLSPFMFRSVLETILQASYRLRKRSLLIRRMLAAYQPAVAAYPMEHGYPALPATWKTLPRFWPLISSYGSRVGEKLARRLGLNGTPPAPQYDKPLWTDASIQEMLVPARMEAASVLDGDALRAFLQAPRQYGFPKRALCNRLLTLEYTLRSAASMRRTSSEQDIAH
jgi:hypothetical protein